jgi:hypothetical protein
VIWFFCSIFISDLVRHRVSSVVRNQESNKNDLVDCFLYPQTGGWEMKRNLLLIIASLVLGVSLFAGQSLAVCPEDPNDNGECDTMYVEIFPPDQQFMFPGPHLARFPIYVTHDLPDAEIDSIASFVIPLCFTHTNPAASCNLSLEWNLTGGPFPGSWEHSVFRPLVDGDDTVYSWMWTLMAEEYAKGWDTRILDLGGGSHFWMALFPTGTQDQKFWEGSRVLLASMTFELDDTTTICVDTCFWPPASNLAFGRSDAVIYSPRHFLPACEAFQFAPGPPHFTECPLDQTHSSNGSGFGSSPFIVETYPPGGEVASVTVYFEGSGVEEETIVFTAPPPGEHVEGYVTYSVTDHCQDGGTMNLVAEDPYGATDFCDFDIVLTNNPPALNLPDTWRALAENFTMALWVSATDPDEDAVTIQLEDYWYEPDSLHSPTNPPSYDGGNPGFLTWAPTEADTGLWIFQFSATDACGEVVTDQIAIQVGMPFCGDCLGDGNVDVSDFICLIHYLFREGPAPNPLCIGDVNCDGLTDSGDLVYLLNYYYKFGPAPCFECCP